MKYVQELHLAHCKNHSFRFNHQKMSNNKLLIITFLLLTSSFAFNDIVAQETIFETDIQLKTGLENKRDVLPVVLDDQSVTLFLLDNAEITSMILDKDFQKTDEYTIPRPEATYDNLLGQSVDGDQYNIFFANRRKNQFYVHEFNMAEKTNRGRLLDIKLKKEKYFESISYQNKFYLLTIKKFTSIMVVYEFTGSQLNAKKEIDLTEFEESNIYLSNLYTEFLSGDGSLTQSLYAPKIDLRTPAPIQQTADPAKLFVSGNKLTMTIDNDLQYTKIIKVDLGTYEHSIEAIKNEPLLCKESVSTSANSFLWESTLFQVKVCKSKLRISVKRLGNEETLAEYVAEREEGIQFKNGPLQQEGSNSIYGQGTEKELNTKQFLRKMSNSQISVSAYEQNEELILKVGGYKELRGNYGNVGTFNTGSTISTPYGTVTTPPSHTYNPAMAGYSTMTTSRSVYFNVKLDVETLQQIEGEVAQTAFDKIRNFEKAKTSSMVNETVFRVGDVYVYGYYHKADKKYVLKGFEDDVLAE